jgi:hypothetical protein
MAYDGRDGSRDGGNFMKSLFDFNYDFTEVETYLKLIAQLSVGVALLLGVKALDGEGCNRRIGFSQIINDPRKALIPPACFIRGVADSIPAPTSTQTQPAGVNNNGNDLDTAP